MTVKEILKIARAEIGVTESPAGSNKVKYNTWFYNKEVRGSAYPWCCAFISWLFRDTSLIPKTASCSTLATWFKKQNRFHSKPQVGDLVFFNFSHPASVADHIGIVDGINANGSIYSIEGNTSVSSDDNGGAVMRRLRNAKIVGYGRPNYEEDIPKEKKPKEVIALEVLEGLWGNGPTRRQKLAQAGYDYKEIQAIVNQLLK